MYSLYTFAMAEQLINPPSFCLLLSVYLFNLFFFEVGSLVSALAPTMGTVLAGRTISGVGAAGLFMGAIQILAESTTIEARAIYMGMLGMLFTVSMIVGPIIGGALSKVTWRWIFYINLPIGGAAFVLVAFIFNARPALGTSKSNPLSLTARLRRLDIVGTALLAGFVCMIIIPISEAQNNGWGSAATWAVSIDEDENILKPGLYCLR